MTAELRQAIEMLQLSAPEIADLVAREVAENPCLEYEDKADEYGGGGESVSGGDGLASGQREGDLRRQEAVSGKGEGEMVEWDMAWDQWAIRDEGAGGPAGEVYGGLGGVGGGDDEGFSWEARATREESLQDFLQKQFEEVVDEPRLRLVGRFLIDAVDEAGYLRVDMAEVAARLKVPEEMVDDARAILQTLDPAGVGARDLAECLRLQMHAAGQLDDVAEVCLEHLDLVALKQWEKLADLANRKGGDGGVDAEEMQLAVAAIQECNPKPAAGFGSARVESVVPDVVVSRKGGLRDDDGVTGLRNEGQGEWMVELNGAAFPRLLAYPPAGGRAAVRGGAGDEAKKYMQERFGRAKWLMSALEQRARTTLAVARAVVAAQSQFFDAGVEFLVPLTLRTVAEQVGVHESTVSRVVNGKYMQTPWGVLGFKYFFASGVGSSGGAVSVAATSVQALIAKMVKGEDPKKPLSDEQLVARLKDEGVEVARRTVAKYRGVLGIPGTAERRLR